MRQRKVVYYKSESEDFVRADADAPVIDKDYKYIRRGAFARTVCAVFYAILVPVVKLFLKIRFSEKYVGREKIRAMRGKPYVMLGNHTQPIADAFTPYNIAFPRRACVVVHPNNLRIPLLGPLLPYVGALPLPSDVRAMRNFLSATEQCIKDDRPLIIYPEAHVWPYYTGLRDFSALSDSTFDLASRYGVPIFCISRVYTKRKMGGAKCTVYIDGPIDTQGITERRALRERVREESYRIISQRVALSDYEHIKYIKVENDE